MVHDLFVVADRPEQYDYGSFKVLILKVEKLVPVLRSRVEGRKSIFLLNPAVF